MLQIYDPVPLPQMLLNDEVVGLGEELQTTPLSITGQAPLYTIVAFICAEFELTFEKHYYSMMSNEI